MACRVSLMDKDLDISLIACHKSRDTCFLFCVSQWSGRGDVVNRVFDSSFVRAIKIKLGILARGWRTSLMGMCMYSFHGPPSVRFPPPMHACIASQAVVFRLVESLLYYRSLQRRNICPCCCDVRPCHPMSCNNASVDRSPFCARAEKMRALAPHPMLGNPGIYFGFVSATMQMLAGQSRLRKNRKEKRKKMDMCKEV